MGATNSFRGIGNDPLGWWKAEGMDEGLGQTLPGV